MKRRDFIKNAILVGCGLSLLPTGLYIHNRNFIKSSNNNFIYKHVRELPKKIRLEFCSLCQLDCPACMIRVQEKEILANEGLGYLKFNDFKKFIDEHSFIKEIEMSNHGEVFLNPEIDKILEYAYKKHVSIVANNGVNLNYISDKTAENLVKYKVKVLRVSIDGATPETYKIYRVGGDFDTVINNIKKINYYKQKYNSKYPLLKWQFIVFGHNEHEIELVKTKAKELNMDVYYTQNGVAGYSPVKDKERMYRLTNKISYEGKSMLPYLEKYINEGGFLACSGLYDLPQIDYNGNLLGCCLSSVQAFKPNVFKDGLMNALNSEDYVYAKKMLADIDNVPIREDIPCANCPMYKDLKKWHVNCYKNKNYT